MTTTVPDRGPEDHSLIRAGEKPAYLEPSELGTKEYWDALYERELRNHAHDPGDRGTVWFEDSDAEARVIGFLRRRHRELLLLPPLPHPHPRRDNHNDKKKKDAEEGVSFLDLGTGNGSLLFGLRDAADDDDGDDDEDDDDDTNTRPFANGRMLGVDYSARSVEFARRIARSRRQQARARQSDQDQDQTQTQTQNGTKNGSRDIDEEAEEEKEEEEGDVDVEFQLHDILHDPATRLLTGAQAAGWDVVLDKGTFDAVSLAPPSSPSTNPTTTLTADSGTSGGGKGEKEGETEAYPRRVLPLVREGGLLVVTSCNWTEDELRRWFEGSSWRYGDGGVDSVGLGEEAGEETPSYRYRFEQVARVEYPSFSFGGVKGQAISTLCFRKVRDLASGR